MPVMDDPRLFPDPSDQEADGGLRVLTIAEVAERLRVDKRTVRRAIRRGDLVASRLGQRGAYRILAREAQAWFARSVVEPARDPQTADRPRAQATARLMAVRSHPGVQARRYERLSATPLASRTPSACAGGRPSNGWTRRWISRPSCAWRGASTGWRPRRAGS